MADPAAEISIGPITAENTADALKLFQSSGRQGDWDELFALMLDDQLDQQSLFVAVRDSVVAGAIWYKILGGSSAQIMSPVSLPGQPDVQRALLLHAVQELREQGVEFATCVVSISDNRDELFRDAGFAFAANVQSMVCPVSPNRILAAGAGLQFDLDPVRDTSELASLVGETYRGSLDCPIVNDYRTAEDLLATYGQDESTCRETWFVARWQSENVGCILLSVEGSQLEIRYFGIVPRFRGRGWGRDLLLFAHRFAVQSGAETLLADVDSKNRPAIAIYESLGYVAFDFNRVFVVSICKTAKSSKRQARAEGDRES